VALYRTRIGQIFGVMDFSTLQCLSLRFNSQNHTYSPLDEVDVGVFLSTFNRATELRKFSYWSIATHFCTNDGSDRWVATDGKLCLDNLEKLESISISQFEGNLSVLDAKISDSRRNMINEIVWEISQDIDPSLLGPNLTKLGLHVPKMMYDTNTLLDPVKLDSFENLTELEIEGRYLHSHCKQLIEFYDHSKLKKFSICSKFRYRDEMADFDFHFEFLEAYFDRDSRIETLFVDTECPKMDNSDAVHVQNRYIDLWRKFFESDTPLHELSLMFLHCARDEKQALTRFLEENPTRFVKVNHIAVGENVVVNETLSVHNCVPPAISTLPCGLAVDTILNKISNNLAPLKWVIISVPLVCRLSPSYKKSETLTKYQVGTSPYQPDLVLKIPPSVLENSKEDLELENLQNIFEYIRNTAVYSPQKEDGCVLLSVYWKYLIRYLSISRKARIPSSLVQSAGFFTKLPSSHDELTIEFDNLDPKSLFPVILSEELDKFSRLRILVVEGVTLQSNSDEAALFEMIHALPLLQTLAIKRCQLMDVDAETQTFWPNWMEIFYSGNTSLEELILHELTVTLESALSFAQELAKVPQIQKLDLELDIFKASEDQDWKLFGDVQLNVLRAATSLENLRFFHLHISDGRRYAKEELIEIASDFLSSVEALTDFNIEISDDLWPKFCRVLAKHITENKLSCGTFMGLDIQKLFKGDKISLEWNQELIVAELLISNKDLVVNLSGQRVSQSSFVPTLPTAFIRFHTPLTKLRITLLPQAHNLRRISFEDSRWSAGFFVDVLQETIVRLHNLEFLSYRGSDNDHHSSSWMLWAPKLEELVISHVALDQWSRVKDYSRDHDFVDAFEKHTALKSFRLQGRDDSTACRKFFQALRSDIKVLK